MKRLKPIQHFKIGESDACTVAVLGGRRGLTLIALVGDDDYHVVLQDAQGSLQHRVGPITKDGAIDAAERVLNGCENSVTGDGVCAIAGLVAAVATRDLEALCRRLEEELSGSLEGPCG